MQEGKYFAVDSAEKIELERLGGLEEALEGPTQRRIEALGIQAGWRCLEVGGRSRVHCPVAGGESWPYGQDCCSRP